MPQTVAQLKAFWTGLPAQRRRIFLFAGVGILAVLIVAVALGSRGPKYVPLFTKLDPQDAAAIVAKLDAAKEPYTVSTDGSTISVPAPDVYKLRLSLASQGLPSSGIVGFSALDKLGFAATNFQRQVDYLRGLQGELTRTILQISGVANARVHIVLPQNKLFDSQSTPATAAVLLTLKPGATLDQSQVRAIAQLVAASVQGLKPSDVSILDNQGHLLTAGMGSSQTALATTAAANDLQLQEQFQASLQHSLDGMLAQVFGAGNVVTHVQAEMNFNQQTVTSDLFQPGAQGQGILKSVQTLREHFQGAGSASGGVPGATSNSIPSYPASSGSAGSNYDKQQTNQDYSVSQVEDKTTVAPGTVKRLSVAVVVNRQLTPTDQQAILQTVSAAIGADPARRDQITVVGMPFSTGQQAPAQASQPAPATPQPLTNPLALAVAAGVVILLLLVLRALFGRRRRAREATAEAQLAAELVAQRPQFEEAENVPSAVSQATEALRERVRRHPDDVASILRLWMSEE